MALRFIQTDMYISHFHFDSERNINWGQYDTFVFYWPRFANWAVLVTIYDSFHESLNINNVVNYDVVVAALLTSLVFRVPPFNCGMYLVLYAAV